MSAAPKIALAGVAKAFGEKQVLRGIDLEVAKGESVVIIGGSGTGKSVMMKTILGLITPDSGSIKVDGDDVIGLKGRALAAHQARFGMLFQGGALFDSLPVWRNISFAVRGPATVRRAAALDNLARVGLGEDVADLRPSALSGGMQKRVALARAIAMRPEIVFFDEPTTGLDPIMADVINALIRQLVSELGITALTITHDMASVRKIADRVAMIYEGRIIWHGPRDKIDNPDNDYVDQFVHGRGGADPDAGEEALSGAAELAGLLARAASGDQLAFRDFYDRTSAKLFGVILRILPERGEAEDVLQDVYLTIWRKAAEFDASRASPVTWTATIARNRAIDRLRAKRVRPTAPMDDAGIVADEAPLADALIDSARGASRVQAALATLEPRHAAAIRSCYFEGMTYEALAVREGVPVGTLKSWVRRGIMKMRDAMPADDVA